MSRMLEYKEYLGSVEYSKEDELLHGRLEFIRDLVTYEGQDVKGIEAAFQEAVDDYLELCEAEGRKPDVPQKGKTPKALRRRSRGLWTIILSFARPRAASRMCR